MFARHLKVRLQEAMADTPVVLLHGARQTGKSTLLQELASGAGLEYRTLDDAGDLAAVRRDPAGYLAAHPRPLAIDEVQRAPELMLALKAAVDRDRQPGRFVLSGSANVMLLPKLSESLVGRMEVAHLWPLSQGELHGTVETFVDRLWAGGCPPAEVLPERLELAGRVLAGGFPEAVRRSAGRRRHAWFESYLLTLLQRDVRELARIEGLTELPRLVQLIAARTAQLSNVAELSATCGLPQTTLKRYLTLLETAFLLQRLPAWSTNLGRRLARAPKLLLSDTGLTADLLGLRAPADLWPHPLAGQLLEAFVALELRKQLTWSETSAQLYHFRTAAGVEVDLLLERADGAVVGLEVKSSVTPAQSDFKGLRLLQATLGERFRAGYLLHCGTHPVPFGERLWAVPLSALWSA